MKTKKPTVNTKTKYTESKNYQKHFTLDDRIKILKIIAEHRDVDGALTLQLKNIGDMLQNDPSTISKEVKHHRIMKSRRADLQSPRLVNSICSNYSICEKIDHISSWGKKVYFKTNGICIHRCKEFNESICPFLKKFPWVCNGCPKMNKCHLNKAFYYPDEADKAYKTLLISSREGINCTEAERLEINSIFKQALTEKKQPIIHIYEANKEAIPVTDRTIYHWIETGILDIKNIDLRRKVTYKIRKSKNVLSKLELKRIKEGRSYEDYQTFMLLNPNSSLVQMDLVEGSKNDTNSPFLLTLHFVRFQFQIAYLIKNKSQESIREVFDFLYEELGHDIFKALFEVILTDNGSEFSNPLLLEVDSLTGEKRCHIFYCHPYASFEKGACEKNHEFIRYFLPKGSSFSFLTQKKVYLMMSHINSIIRPRSRASAFDFMALEFGRDILDKLHIVKINPQDVILSKDIFLD